MSSALSTRSSFHRVDVLALVYLNSRFHTLFGIELRAHVDRHVRAPGFGQLPLAFLAVALLERVAHRVEIGCDRIAAFVIVPFKLMFGVSGP